VIIVPYDKLLAIFDASNIIRDGERIKIVFKPPSLAEAASSSDVEYEAQRYYIIEGKIKEKDNEVIIERVYLLENENYIRDLDEEEIRIWLEYILSS